MATSGKSVRQSVSLPSRIARRVKTLATAKKTSANRVLVDLLEAGLAAQDEQKQRFFDLADRFARSTNPEEQKRLKDDLARMTFGE